MADRIDEVPQFKYPQEVLIRDFNFKGAGMATGEIVTGVVSSNVNGPDSALVMDNTVASNTGPTAQARFSGGTAGATYTVRMTVTTNFGQTLTMAGRIVVEAAP